MKNAKSKFGGMSDLFTCICKNHCAVKSISFITVGTEVLDVFKKATLK